ncbi:hypothetical protein [Paenibacillus sp. M2]|uniref:hypothetical protein n=1 Tax=Paenibacillus sp. M2 TaxID=3341793 RepID=UPI0039897383
MAKVDSIKVEINVDTHELDEAIAKAERLNALLERGKELRDKEHLEDEAAAKSKLINALLEIAKELRGEEQHEPVQND